MEAHPSEILGREALDNISFLDCDKHDQTIASCNPNAPLPADANAWKQTLEHASVVDDVDYSKALTIAFKSLVCSGGEDAIYVLRGLFRGVRGRTPNKIVLVGSRLKAAGPEAPRLVDDIMGKDCPVSASLTADDKAKLLSVKQEAIVQCEQKTGVFRRSRVFRHCVEAATTSSRRAR